jgi:hypothetical protein
MSLTISQKSIRSFLVILPFVLVYIGVVFLKVNHPVGTIFKLAAFGYMIMYALIHNKTDKNLLSITLLFLLFLVYAIWHSFNINAGIQAGLRYLFPIVTLFYGYSIRKHIDVIVKFMIVFVIINFIAQFYNYYGWIKHQNMWYYPQTINGEWYFNSAMGVLRASGIVVFFCFFGYMNMIAFFVIKRFYHGKYKKIILAIALLMFLASLSYKTIVSFILVLTVYYYKKILNLITFALLFVIGLMMALPLQTKNFIDNLLYRVDAYIFMSKPTLRSETYILMWQDIIGGDWFGHGAGSFGGPASFLYNSPYYKEVNFQWLDTFWMKMSTVDTFPPHVFIELGIVGGLLFFLVLLTPLIRRKVSSLVLIIYFTLFIDMLFTFSLAGLDYLMFSLVLVYPIYHYDRHISVKENKIIVQK